MMKMERRSLLMRRKRRKRRKRRRTITNQTLTMLYGSRDRGPAVLRGVCCTG